MNIQLSYWTAICACAAALACGSENSTPQETKSDAGSDAAADAKSDAPPAPCTVGEFRCTGDLLETCAANGEGFQPVATCKAGLCDAAGKQCDTCVAGEGQCDGDGKGFSACDATGQKEEATSCSAPAPVCADKAGKPACVECKTGTDCPATSSDCQLAACSADGTCGVSSVAKDTPCGAAGSGGKCDGDGACVYCAPGEKRCTGLVPESCDSAGKWVAAAACSGSEPLCLAGACVQCASATDCPSSSNDCLSAVCSANKCGFSPKAQGAACASGSGQCNGAGQCNVCQPGNKICNGNTPLLCGTNGQYAAQPACTGGTPICDPVTGNCVQCTAVSQCPASSNACLVAACSNNACGFANAPTGTACSVGNDAGTCASGACQVCSAGQTRCKPGAGNVPQACASGLWVDQSACSGATPVCSAGSCVPPCTSVQVAGPADLAGPVVSVEPDSAKAACFEAWAKTNPTGPPGAGNWPGVVFGMGTNIPGQAVFWVYCYPNSISLDVATPAASSASASKTCNDGNWHHYAVCFTSSQSKLYFDGALAITNVSPNLKSAVLHLGSWGAYPTVTSSLIDEFRISTGTRYTGTFTPEKRFTLDASTLHLWHLDEGSGTTSVDAVSGGNTLTLPSGVAWSTSCP